VLPIVMGLFNLAIIEVSFQYDFFAINIVRKI
jgi:hypothetical protein